MITIATDTLFAGVTRACGCDHPYPPPRLRRFGRLWNRTVLNASSGSAGRASWQTRRLYDRFTGPVITGANSPQSETMEQSCLFTTF